MDPQVVAIVVTYRPDLDGLLQLLRVLTRQVDLTVVVDNGSSLNLQPCLDRFSPHHVALIALDKNMGIAFAQNRGIEVARERNAQFVLLMDQDSLPKDDMVQKLLRVAVEKRAGAVGPCYLDPRHENPPPFIRIHGLRLERVPCSTAEAVVPVDYLVSSGCLIPMRVLEHVGGMREDFFIDFVDIEWGLRTRRFGYQCYGACSAKMSHCLGHEPIQFFKLKFPVHSPLRHYYHFRNAALLSQEKWVPRNWKLINGWRMCLKYVFYSLFARPRFEQWRMMTLGVMHGLQARSGKYMDP